MTVSGAILLAGLPGAGKSSLCAYAQSTMGVKVITLMRLVKECLASPAPAANDVRSFAASGTPLSDIAFSSLLASSQDLRSGVFVCDSFPKGRAQAEELYQVVPFLAMVLVESDENACRSRATIRSPSRFTPVNVDSKFARRREESTELANFCRSVGVPVHTLRNFGTLEEFLEEGRRLLGNILQRELGHA